VHFLEAEGILPVPGTSYIITVCI